MAVVGRDAFGVELDAVDGFGFVGYAHDDAIVGLRGDLQGVGAGFAFDDEGVIAGDGER